MIKFIIRRLLGIIPVLFIVATVTFFLIRLAPGGPFDTDRQIPEDILKNINARFHLDEPLYMQYFRYLGSLLQGDLGPSFRYASYTVNDIIAETWHVSAALGFCGLIYALCLGISAGVLAASKPNSLRDFVPMTFSLIGVCLPSFVIGPLFILIFGIGLDWFNVSGWNQPLDLVLPSMSLGTLYAAYISRLTRGGLMDIIRQDYIRTARAKGVREHMIMLRHTLKGGLLPVISFLGPATAGILVGSFVVESIFNIPGLGRFFVQSALNRDYTLVMGMVLLFAALLLVLNLVVDIAYAFLDPRVSYES
jgi:oligopeptide transport system permease protein